MECRTGCKHRGITAETVPGDIEERGDPRSDEWCSRRNAAADGAGTPKPERREFKIKRKLGEARLPLRLLRL